jgi:hypothetical protein
MGKGNKQSKDLPAVAGPPRWLRAAELTVAVAVAVLAVGTIWGEPRPIGDLYAGLAVGQDVMDGKLGKPDDWSFMTQGRVAINQNWGTHFLHYLVYEGFGTTGLLVLKVALIGGAGLFICLAARQRQVSWPVALVVAAGAIAAGRSYIDLRANLTTLTVAPLALWLMFKSRRNTHWMWAVMVLNGIWANVHGGFIFGLGMTALWAGVLFVQRLIERQLARKRAPAAPRPRTGPLWPLPVATIGSVLLAAYANPYGPINLTFPFQILEPAWQNLNEWKPLLDPTARFGTTWEFFTLMGLLGGLLLIRVAGIPGVPASYPRLPNLQQACMAVFDVVLAAVVIGMTFKARRFVPLSAIVLAPFLAMQLQWLLDLLRRADRLLGPVALGAMAVALAVPLGLHAEWLSRLYNPNNPRRLPQTLFERMNGTDAQPVGGAEFLAENHITGRCFNEWRWEGYLRWKCPGIQIFMGGRAHQVYTGATDMLGWRIRADVRTADPRYGLDPARDLANLDCHLVAVPTDPPGSVTPMAGPLLWYLLERPEATWAYLYVDPNGFFSRDVIAADGSSPQTAELIRRAIAGDLKYPDEATARLSQAMAMTARWLRIPATETLEAFLAAVQAQPSTLAYDAIAQLARGLPDGGPWQRTYFQQEYARLAAMDYHRAGGCDILLMRAQLAEYLAGLYRREGDAQESFHWTQVKDNDYATYTTLAREWP